MLVAIIIAAYAFIGTTIGSLLWPWCQEKFTCSDAAEALPVLSGLFWPAAMFMWGGYFFAKYLIKQWVNTK